MIDMVFDIAGASVPTECALALLGAIAGVLPWLASTEGVGVHPLRGSATDYGELLLARRAKLVLRVPAARGDDCTALAGRTLAVGGGTLAVGPGNVRPLRPSATLHAQRVASATVDAREFDDEVACALGALGITGAFISGRARREVAGTRAITGFALSVHELNAADSLRLQTLGIGAERALGWGIFVPAKTITIAD